jgi:pimeloyl-ACP methyl ester carboxylesterase
MAFAALENVELFYTDEGAGDPPLLFVHGYACDSHDWSWQLPHFASRHRVLAVDLRGHGRSSAPPDGYEPYVFAADLAELIARLGCGPVVAVGHSLGALVLSALAVEHPETVRALVAVDPAYLVSDAVAARIPSFASALATEDPVAVVQRMLGGSDTPACRPFLRTWHLRRVAGVPAHVLTGTFAGMATGPKPLLPRATGEDLIRGRRCPVLSFYIDPTRVPIETALFDDARSKSVSWEGSGHWLHQERPDEFNALVDAWLASALCDP